MESYGIFLMVELLRLNGVISKDLEYDLTWERAVGEFESYDDSEFNVDTAGEFECIQAYIEDTYPKEREDLLKQQIGFKTQDYSLIYEHNFSEELKLKNGYEMERLKSLIKTELAKRN